MGENLGYCEPHLNMSSSGAAGSIAVTVPTVWYLLANGPDASQSHGDNHGKSHGEEKKTDDGTAEKSEEKSGGADEKNDDKDSEKTEDSDSEEEVDTPETSDDEGEEGDKEDGNTKKSVPDAKGGNKKRIESDKGKTQGEVGAKGDEGEPTDKVCGKRLLNAIISD